VLFEVKEIGKSSSSCSYIARIIFEVIFNSVKNYGMGGLQ